MIRDSDTMILFVLTNLFHLVRHAGHEVIDNRACPLKNKSAYCKLG